MKRMMKVSTPTICLTTSWAANPTNRINDNNKNKNDDDDDDDNEVKFGCTRAAPNDAQVKSVCVGWGRQRQRERVRESERQSRSRSRCGSFIWFRFGFLERRISAWIDAQSFGWMKWSSVWKLLHINMRAGSGRWGCDYEWRECGIMFLLMLSNGYNNCKLPALENLIPHTHTLTHTYDYFHVGPKRKEKFVGYLFSFFYLWLGQRVECSERCRIASCILTSCFFFRFYFSGVCFDLLWKFGFHNKLKPTHEFSVGICMCACAYVCVCVRACVWLASRHLLWLPTNI